MEGAARAGGDGRHTRHHPRAVAGDQHVRRQFVPLRRDEVAQSDRAALLAGFQHQFQVEPELAAALRQHRFQRGQVQRVLALVVGGAATVPAIALLGQRPGIEAVAPLVVQPADRVAVAVGQHGRPRRIFHPFGDQNGAEAGRRIGMDRDGEAHALQPGLDRSGEIPLHIRRVPRVLRGAGDRHEFRQMVAEPVRIEIGHCARHGAVPRWHIGILG